MTLMERLRERGWRVTAQRRAVAEAIAAGNLHLSADEVHHRARQAIPEISLATVYNTLNELVAMGELLKVQVASGPVRYDPNTATDHHHLVCTECDTLYDVFPTGVEGVALSADEQRGFIIDQVDITFRGRCPSCAA
jgi:Fur family ferric uptake transcriptional regulator